MKSNNKLNTEVNKKFKKTSKNHQISKSHKNVNTKLKKKFKNVVNNKYNNKQKSPQKKDVNFLLKNKQIKKTNKYVSSDDDESDDDAGDNVEDSEIAATIKDNCTGVREPSETGTDKESVEIETVNKKRREGVTVFVGNLPVNIKRKKLLKLFSKFGTVLSIRFRSNDGQRFFRNKVKVKLPFLIAFIDFENVECARASLSLNGEKIAENIIRVNLQADAKQKTSFDPLRTIYVGNLKYSVTDEILHDTFNCCGKIDYVRTLQCEKGCKGSGYVCFSTPASVKLALEMNKELILNREAVVSRYSVKKLGNNDNEKTLPKKLPNRKQSVMGKGKQHKNVMNNFNSKKSDEINPTIQKKKDKSTKEFRGVKSDKKKKKNRKRLSGVKLLAKRIAPRDQQKVDN